MKKYCFTLWLLWLMVPRIGAQPASPALHAPPPWAKNAIWYQVFVERFYNGDPSNDPKPHHIHIPALAETPKGWSVTPWTFNWMGLEEWAKQSGKPLHEALQYRRYGGDLQGLLDKLDYLQALGVTALFLNPINDAPSLHKYDARHYHHVDINFGPDPQGDARLIAGEDPTNPASWQWTSADKLFLTLVAEIHRRNMKIILDYSWNHTGTLFWAWQDVVKHQQKSAFKDWYAIKQFDDPLTPQNEFAYEGWAGVPTLPELRKVEVRTPRVTGLPYEGNIDPGAKAHIMAVTRRWLAPDGDPGKGIDGFRLDVADQIGLGFWREFRTQVRSLKADAYLVGEIWWQQWPDKLMDPVPYTGGDVFDAVMFYQVYRPARYFFAKTNFEINARQFRDSLQFQWNRLPAANRYAMMNVSSSHDAPRLLTDFYNPNQYKYKASPHDNPAYQTGKPDKESYQRLQLYLVHAFTTVGAPHIFNGEEMGMWGADDPYNRKPLWWPEYRFQPETLLPAGSQVGAIDSVGFNPQQFNFYQKLISIRKNNPVLATGEIAFMSIEGKRLAYRRYDASSEIIVVFNLETTTGTFSFPNTRGGVNLLTDLPIKGATLSLPPLSAAVIKVK